MSQRTQPALILNNSPLVLVLTQLRFPAYLHMHKCVPDIQEALRGRGLSRFSTEETQQVVFGTAPKQTSKMRWVFGDRSRTEAVVLADNFFVFEVSSYESFDRYVERMLEVLQPILDQAKLSYADQLGIRYVDLLQGTNGISADDMVCESLRGVGPSELGLDESNYQFVIQGKTSHGMMSIRSYENTGDQFLPPDLQSEHLKFEKQASSDSSFRVIDFDHIHRGEVDLERDVLENKLWELHNHTDIAFRKLVTSDALDYWKDDSR